MTTMPSPTRTTLLSLRGVSKT
ncbi:MAG: hypothetical protein JWQ15_616, partial [Marmoricola sp.]|nr:hypothetical protein [Marmoricola sp.]